MSTLVRICLGGLLLWLGTIVIAAEKEKEVWYQITCQYWEWTSADEKSARGDIPATATLSETILFLPKGGKTYYETKIGIHILAYGVVDTVSVNNKPIIRVLFKVTNNSKVTEEWRELSGSGEAYLPEELGKKVPCGLMARGNKGKFYSSAVTCIVRKMNEEELDAKIKSLGKK